MSEDRPGNRDFGRRDFRARTPEERARAQEERARRREPAAPEPRPASEPRPAPPRAAAPPKRRGAPTPPRRAPRRRGGGHGHALLWLAVIVGLILMAGYAMARSLRGGGAHTRTAAEVPVKVTFPEGLRREDIAKIIGEKTNISPEEYLRLTASGAQGQHLAGVSSPRSLEGFLFPATYDIFTATTAQDLVDQQLAAYRDNTAGIGYAAAARKNLTKYDVLIIASLVEREVRRPDERRVVAGVIYNRLHNHMRLDIDATVQYALGSWKSNLTQADLSIDSPYNTRRFKGLPPGPISNPGVASIRAAANPVRTPYLYYVARNDGSGGHYFATTEAQFQADIARSQRNAGG